MPEKSEAAKREEKILAFWEREHIFEKSLEKKSPKGEFVFYDGPPFATGLPHSGSLLSSVSKDLIPRYKTMRGYFVRRRWGWDTHGLPIESLVEKKLGLKNKKEILALGIEKFNETARAMVLEYVHDWKRYIERVGRWVDFDNAYKTMDNSYIESVWWALKEIHKKGRLYEGKKVLMYCPHCETPLAKAEIAMDNTYKDITEEAATVKFKIKNPEKYHLPENTFLLAWTTTPWTLPGNVALAVGKDIEYQITEENGMHFVRAGKGMKGSDLVGIEYEPLYEIEKVKNYEGKKWQVFAGNFVTTEEGTGIVHIAPSYGEDDFNLGKRENLPMIQLLNPNATYNDDTPAFLRGEYIRKANQKIIEDLESRKLLFVKEAHTHSYPHCYRCGTPLIYNAVSSWFIDIQSVKAKMISENEKIDWIPKHLKEGRFKHNLETAPDWTISRNRFWASPLPIWKDKSGNVTVIGSLEELKKHTKKSGNKYFLMRHGEAENNVRKVFNANGRTENGLTEKGKDQTAASAKQLVAKGITKIYSSPLLRTRETAETVAQAIGISKEKIIFDERLRELDVGKFDGTSAIDEFSALRAEHNITDPIPGGESYLDAIRRFGSFLYEIENELRDKRVLIVSHGIAFKSLEAIVKGWEKKEAWENILVTEGKAEKGEFREFDFVPLPHNRDYELDYHLPYIDRIQLEDEKGEPLTRIPEVVDCWVESGSMPFAEYHYPFENQKEFEKRTPSDFVSEYIGQTRAWFYYLHAIGVEVFDRLAFRHVITTGNILAADGAKFSKSKGNFTDPYELFDRYGADAFRYYLMSSVLMQAEDLAFRDEDVKDAHARVVNMLRNILAFYSLYKDDAGSANDTSENILDRWILARLRELIMTMTEAFDRYDVPRATRPMREFIDDFSTWYVRRSRDRVKGEDIKDKNDALVTMRYVLREFSKVIAPVMPFIAEEIFQEVRESSDAESVHLADWPEVKNGWTKKMQNALLSITHAQSRAADALLIAEMARVRELASHALQQRQNEKIKVRQPLAKLSVPDELSLELSKILAEEVNVKQVLQINTADNLKINDVVLDTTLTLELIKEGDEREMVRAVAEARKAEGFSPRDAAHVKLNPEGKYGVILSTGEVRFDLVRDAA